jgi:nucleoside-diphosphate-sugar epimerase
MRIYLTGASGFVGSNLAHVFAVELPDLDATLRRLRAQLESSCSVA